MNFFVHIVSYNSEKYLKLCLQSLAGVEVLVTDNASSDRSVEVAKSFPGVKLNINQQNLGFCAAHNQGVASFLESTADCLVILNPDAAFSTNFFEELRLVFLQTDYKIITPKILRADSRLQPLEPAVFDAAGMILTRDLRHLDRAAGELDTGQFSESEAVFGGTGACLIITRQAVIDLLIKRTDESSLFEIYPQLEENADLRPQLFDEAFFAYREDADLAWRAANLGIQTLYSPKLLAYHVRRVVPERRSQLPEELNSLSVKNRFLLQLNNYRYRNFAEFVHGIVIRNLFVIAGVLVFEQSSLKGLMQAFKLARRAVKQREGVLGKL